MRIAIGSADDFCAGAVGRFAGPDDDDTGIAAGTAGADARDSLTETAGPDGCVMAAEGTGVAVLFGGCALAPARGASKPSFVLPMSPGTSTARGDGVVSRRRGAGPAVGGLGRPGAESRSGAGV